MATLTVACDKSFINAAKSELKTFDPSSDIRTRDYSNRQLRCSKVPKHVGVQLLL
jgi:hypothetical protein